MKICMVFSTPFPPEEGIGYYIYNLSKNLLKNGHEVVIITRGSWKKMQREYIDGIEVIKATFIPIYPFNIKIHENFINKVFKLLESDIDLVHFHSPLPPFIKTTRPKITTIHTPMLTDSYYVRLESIYSMFSKIYGRVISYPTELKLIQASDVVMTVSSSIAQELKEKYLSNTREAFIVGNGVDEKIFHPIEKKYENNNKYILYVGHIDREKGLFDLLECGKYICKEKSDISFILAGRGRDFNKLKRKIIKLGLQDRFILLGQVSKEKLVKLYQNATLFVFPSYHEGLPTALLEAMSCGLPIIATNTRGNKDIISHGENGLLVPPRNPKKIAEAISLLLDDKHLRKTYGCNARKSIEDNYTWDKVSNKVLRCYQSVLEKQR